MQSSELETIIEYLKSVEKRKKPKLLVVDDEPDNLDLLYRTFRREFQVIKAENGIKALEALEAEGEVAVIISDQRMPEMKGTEFLSKTVPQFPNTVRIILTGFTDVEDLVDAINSGQVYKYITKPWDPNELKSVVQRATETYEVLNSRLEELQRSQAQTELMGTILDSAQHSASITDGLREISQALSKAFSVDCTMIQLIENDQLTTIGGSYGGNGSNDTLAQDPLVKSAIAQQTMQIWVNSNSNPPPEGAEFYQNLGLQMNLIVPISYRSNLLAILALQWQKPFNLLDNEVKLIHLAAKQVALAIKECIAK